MNNEIKILFLRSFGGFCGSIKILACSAKYSKKKKNCPSPSMRIPIQYRAEGAAVGAWVLLEPNNEEEQTEGAVGGGG